MWFTEHFSSPKLAAQFVTPIVSAMVEQIWREKMSENHIPFDKFEMNQLQPIREQDKQ